MCLSKMPYLPTIRAQTETRSLLHIQKVQQHKVMPRIAQSADLSFKKALYSYQKSPFGLLMGTLSMTMWYRACFIVIFGSLGKNIGLFWQTGKMTMKHSLYHRTTTMKHALYHLCRACNSTKTCNSNDTSSKASSCMLASKETCVAIKRALHSYLTLHSYPKGRQLCL